MMTETRTEYLEFEFDHNVTESKLGKLALALIRDYILVRRIDKRHVMIELTPGANMRTQRALDKLGIEWLGGR